MFDVSVEMSQRDPDVQVWDDLADDEKKLYLRMMEVFAGFVSYTNEQFGRILDFLDDLGELDKTLIMYRIVSDKALPEGDVTIQYGFEVTGDTDFSNGSGAPGTGILAVNGEKVGSVDMDKTTPFIFCIEGLSIGYGYGDASDHPNYRDAFPFTGTITKVTYDISGDAIHDAEAVARRLLGRQ